ncbi:MAG: hypothetical protein JKX81_06850, partial [Arenicella sp.]|nr:hypothetical protein [Arenicella sp.]
MIRNAEVVQCELVTGVPVKIVNVLLLIWLLAVSVFANAQPIGRGDVPSPLSPWVDWVLQDETNIGCPYRYDQNQQTCAWPSR